MASNIFRISMAWTGLVAGAAGCTGILGIDDPVMTGSSGSAGASAQVGNAGVAGLAGGKPAGVGGDRGGSSGTHGGLGGGRGGSGGTMGGAAGLGGSSRIGGQGGIAPGGTTAAAGVGGQNEGGRTTGGAATTGGVLQQGGLGGGQNEGGTSGTAPGGAAGQGLGGTTQVGTGGNLAGAGTSGGTGGAGLGGGAETGGTLTGGAPAGGTGSGGTATGGTPPHVFVGGPCIVSPEMATANTYVYARGDDQKIHRAIITSAGSSSGWAPVSGLDASVLAQGADDDLDCHSSRDSTTTITHIVAMSSMPSGEVRHTSGSDVTFAAFSRVALVSTYDLGPSVESTAVDGSYYLGLKDLPSTGVTGLTRVTVDATGTATIFSPKAPITVSLTSGTDFAFYGASGFSLFRLAAFDANGQLEVPVYVSGPSSKWEATTYFDPPIGQTFQFSPSICIARSYSVGADNPHLVVTAGNRLWHTVRVSSTWGGWQQVANAEIASSPDCVVTDDEVTSIVATTTQGTVVYVHGSSGTFTEVDLGRMGG